MSKESGDKPSKLEEFLTGALVGSAMQYFFPVAPIYAAARSFTLGVVYPAIQKIFYHDASYNSRTAARAAGGSAVGEGLVGLLRAY